MNSVDGSGRPHVFRVQRCDAVGLTETEDHAIPVGQAIVLGQIKSVVQHGGSGQKQRKQIAECLDMLGKLDRGKFPLIPPIAELLDKFAEYLPKQKGRLNSRAEVLKEQLCLDLLRRFI